MARARQLLFAALPSRLKVLALRLHGGHVGRHVRIGIGTVIDAAEVTLEDGAKIGHQTFLSCRTLKMGRDSEIGSRAYIDLTRLQIGTQTHINDEVILAGPRSPHSTCTIGNRCIVLMRAFINTSREVVIEDNVGIGNEAMIFTHGVWQSAFDGYPFSYLPVTLRKGCWIPARVFIMPGVEVGEGATVGANSLVTKSIPPRALAFGAPAKVVSEPPGYPRKLTAEEKRALLLQMAREFVEQLRFEGTPVEESWQSEGFSIRSGMSLLQYSTAGAAAGGDRSVSILLEGGDPAGGFWLHLGTQRSHLPEGDPLSERFEAFVRVYGVHCERV